MVKKKNVEPKIFELDFNNSPGTHVEIVRAITQGVDGKAEVELYMNMFQDRKSVDISLSGFPEDFPGLETFLRETITEAANLLSGKNASKTSKSTHV